LVTLVQPAANDRVGLVYNTSDSGEPPFSGAECDAAVRWAETHGRLFDRTVVNGVPAASGRSIQPRERGIGWLPRKLSDIVAELNRHIWRFDITRLSGVFILRYDAGEELPQHVDLDEAFSDRKLGILLQLSPRDAYEGGRLEYGSVTISVASRGQGSLLVFPTWVPHRVSRMTRGRRYVAGCFALGPSFR
jgi:PKHD-type hydroxylase